MSNNRNFGLAKEKLKNIFIGIQDYGAFTSEHIIDLSETYPDVIYGNELHHLLDYRFKIDEIYEVLTHTHMKVAVFGRASSGKSTVLNAMLGENVLPNGIGHETNGFLQVEGSHTANAYLCTKDLLSIQHDVESAIDLAYILNNYIKPDTKEFVHVYWPKEKCGLLKDDVILVDSPGIDITPYLDEFNYDPYINADAFVLVVNAEFASMDPMYKTIGWSSMVAAATIYGSLCLYDYLSSTTKAKEQSLKNQYVGRPTSNVQSSVGFTSANYSQQVQQGPPTTFKQSDQLFDELQSVNINEEMT